MFKTVLSALAAATLIAAPAVAQTNSNFVGPRIELNGGFADVERGDVDYGASVGGDAAVSDRLTLGLGLDTRNTFDANEREFGVHARLGVALNRNALVYVQPGFSVLHRDNAKDVQGLNASVGGQLALTDRLYTGLEYRYTRFEDARDRNGFMANIGLRF